MDCFVCTGASLSAVTENRAYVLICFLTVVSTFAVGIGFDALGARSEVTVMVGMFVLFIASFSVGVVGVHYDPERRARKRR